MRTPSLLLALLFVCLCRPVTAQLLSAHRDVAKECYPFWVYTPTDYDSNGTKKPLILFLHGAGSRSTNMEQCLRYGPIDALRRGKTIDAVVVAPQLPPRARWNADKLLRLTEWVQQHYAVDTNRLYVIGMSLGAYGTLDFAGTYPHKIAAAMALCGGSDLKDFCGLNQLPLWILHGTADRSVGISQSKKIVAAMEACGSTERLIFTPLSGMNHSDLARIFYLSTPYEWLFSHSLSDDLRRVNRSFSIEVNDLRNAYRDLSRQTIPTKKATTKASSSQNKQYYKVRSGDTLGHIALRYGTSVKRLCQLNGIKENSTLQIGQKLRVK